MRRLLPLILCLSLLTAIAAAVDRGPSTPAERQRALEIIQKLQMDPLNPSMSADRQWVHEFVVGAPDVNVVICTAILKPLIDEPNSEPRRALLLQNLLSMAAYDMENSAKGKDSTAMQMAGAEGMLTAYGNIQKRKPDYKSKFMEDLKAQKEGGTLESYVRQGESVCRARHAGTKLLP